MRELFAKVLASGQKTALASSANSEKLKLFERIANIQGLVDVQTSSADAEKSTPHPDIFEVALQRLGLESAPDQAVVVDERPAALRFSRTQKIYSIGTKHRRLHPAISLAYISWR